MAESGFTIWLSGGADQLKEAISNLLRAELARRDHTLELLDGSLGFETRGPDEPCLRSAYAARLLNRHGISAVVLSKESCRSLETRIRAAIIRFMQVNLDASPVPKSQNPDLMLSSNASDPQACCQAILTKLEEMGFIPAQEAYTEDEKREVEKRLKDLGYM